MFRSSVHPSESWMDYHIALNMMHRGGGQRKSKEPKVSPAQRIPEFPGDGWTSVSGKIFCQGCKEKLSLIRSSCSSYVKSKKHIVKKETRAKLLLRDAAVKEDLVAYYSANPGEKGAIVCPEAHVDRYTITRGFAAAAVPLEKIDMLRPVLERPGTNLTDSSHLRKYIPKIESAELATIEAELKNDRGSLTIDGTRQNGEALAGVWRSCPDLILEHRLVLFKTRILSRYR